MSARRLFLRPRGEISEKEKALNSHEGRRSPAGGQSLARRAETGQTIGLDH